MSEWHKIFRNGPVLTHSPEEMRELGRQIGKILMPGEILGVVGELGAGKTHLTQGIMEGLGSSEAAASPTFSLVHEHADGRLPACHFDFYRLKDESELTGIGWKSIWTERLCSLSNGPTCFRKRCRKKPHGCCWNMKEAACAACLWLLRNKTEISTRCFEKTIYQSRG